MQMPLKLVECPRDAMQGLHEFIPTEMKARYINALLTVGFDTIDFGSFVSAKAIPQMRDTEAVLRLLDLSNTSSKLLAIVANLRGAAQASSFPEIDVLGFPFSLSETFQQRNTNRSMDASLLLVDELLSLCEQHKKTLVLYLSMGFGNPYGDPWNSDLVTSWAKKFSSMGVKTLSIADTTGMSTVKSIKDIVSPLVAELPEVEVGVHLHSTKEETYQKVTAAIETGCKRIDSALLGFGGCPMAANDLTGNIATEIVIATLNEQKIATGIDTKNFETARLVANQIFLGS